MKPLLNVDLPSMRQSVSRDKAIMNKSKKKAPAKKGGGLSSTISNIRAKIDKYLGKYKKLYRNISTEKELNEYVDGCIKSGIFSIDTETTGLDPLVDKIVGFSMFCPEFDYPIYVPINHKSFMTGVRTQNQLNEKQCREALERLDSAGIDVIMFNATFDERVLRNQLGVDLECTWDCSLASRCLNENEEEKSLKKLYKKYILKGKEEAFKFEELFDKVGFDRVPLDIAYLYGAHDAIVTFRYYEYQLKFLGWKPEDAKEGLKDVSWVFHNIEMPCVKAVTELEDTGVKLDMEYVDFLDKKYSKILEQTKKDAYKVLDHYQDEILAYDGNVRLASPINLDSPKQIAVVLYDIMEVTPVDKKSPRGTGEEILKKIDNDFTRALLKYRGIAKLMSTYITKMPQCVNHKDGRVHCEFNQYGANTGRFSSKNPNLQNIPSHNKDIRKMFKATDGYVMMSSDFSQQEIKGMAQMCGDEGMIQSFREGKDFYAQIASVSFGVPYEDCLEHQVDENGNYILDKNGNRVENPEGAERRSQAKSILLGINYGRGAASIAEQLGCSKKKAEKIKEDVFKGFPAIKKFEEDSINMAETKGYVTTLWGRKRRLPIMMRPDYEFEWKEGASVSNDPLDFDNFEEIEEESVPDDVIEEYTAKLNSVWKQQDKNYIIAQAAIEGIKITDNRSKRIDATREVVNSRIQGTAADQSKLAMIAIHRDKRLKELGFRMLIPVHDEIIAECPKENARECRDRFKMLMETCGGDKFTIPISCDIVVTDRWYGEQVDI